HPTAVKLLDKIAPPPPTGVEASVLDPDDPLLVKDAAYQAWRAALPAKEQMLVGLRVSWRWTQGHMDVAPDTREFRLYFQPGRINTRLGTTTTVTSAGATESWVDTDIPNPEAADAYVDARLQIQNASFRIVGSNAGTPLRVRVANVEAKDDVRPQPNAPC